ncbi:hypothetical protein Y09_3278 [Brachybacterium sp. SW0106-09]|nr:hypothetical protein Y09_3278 [Brachybacterium sp. SW0106-09]
MGGLGGLSAPGPGLPGLHGRDRPGQRRRRTSAPATASPRPPRPSTPAPARRRAAPPRAAVPPRRGGPGLDRADLSRRTDSAPAATACRHRLR